VLHERRRARRVVLDELAEVGHERGRGDDPAQAPAGHQPRLGKAVGADHALVRRGQVEERRRRRHVVAVIEAFVHVVGHEPDAVPAAVIEDRQLLASGERPSGRVVRRVDERKPRAGCERRQQPVEVELPHAATALERDALDVRRQDLRNLDEIRPKRRHHDHAIARRDERLDREHERRHARCGDGDRVLGGRAMQARDVRRDRRAQRRDAEVLRVERLSARDRRDTRIADELRRDFVRLAEPERENVGVAHAFVGDVADERGGERAHRGTRGRVESGSGVGHVRLILRRSRVWQTGSFGLRSFPRAERRAPFTVSLREAGRHLS